MAAMPGASCFRPKSRKNHSEGCPSYRLLCSRSATEALSRTIIQACSSSRQNSWQRLTVAATTRKSRNRPRSAIRGRERNRVIVDRESKAPLPRAFSSWPVLAGLLYLVSNPGVNAAAADTGLARLPWFAKK